MESQKPLVLVTGATGYLASHVIVSCLKAGLKVRGSVRSLKDEKKYEHIKKLAEKEGDIEFCEGDLTNHKCWIENTKGCTYVLHVASPLPLALPKHENELIKPAVEGTKAVLSAALQNGVKKVVVTSSSATIMCGNWEKACTEEQNAIESQCTPYEKSKLLAERAVWDFHREHFKEMDITVINPGLILGPVFSKNQFASGEIMVRIMKDQLPAIPKLSFPIVDARDCGDAHVKALLDPKTNGKRYLVCNETLWTKDMVDICRGTFSQYGYKFAKREVPKCPMKLVGMFDPAVKLCLPWIGLTMRVDTKKSKEELGVVYRPAKDTVLDTAWSMIEVGLVEDKRKGKKNQCF